MVEQQLFIAAPLPSSSRSLIRAVWSWQKNLCLEKGRDELTDAREDVALDCFSKTDTSEVL